MLARSRQLAVKQLASAFPANNPLCPVYAGKAAVACFHATPLGRSALPAPSIKVDMRRANYDELSTPDGPWQEFYDLRQKRNNIMLAAGTVSLLVTGLYIWVKDPFHWEKACKPRKFMKNPPQFQIPTNAEVRAFKLKNE